MELSLKTRTQLKDVLTKMPIEAAYIFGSFAHGATTKKSDVDIAILCSENTSREERFALRLEVMGKISTLCKRDADIVVLNDVASLFFQYVILREGKILYQKSEGTRIEFEMKVLSRYFDFLPFLESYNRQYVQTNLQ